MTRTSGYPTKVRAEPEAKVTALDTVKVVLPVVVTVAAELSVAPVYCNWPLTKLNTSVPIGNTWPTVKPETTTEVAAGAPPET